MSELQRTSGNPLDRRVSITPENEIGLTYGLVEPDHTTEEIISKNLRIGNLTGLDHAKVNAGGFLVTYLEGLIESKKLELDTNLRILKKEVLKDINIVQLSSVSRGGFLSEGILSPKKRFQIVPDRKQGKLEQTRESAG